MSGRVAIVTGAAGGQGRAIAERLVQDGYAVVGCDRPEAGAPPRSGVSEQVVMVEADVTSEEDWSRVVGTAVDRFGGVNVLVNNAGVLHRAPMAEETAAGMTALWQVNCLGPFLGMQAARAQLARAEDAAVVNTCSTSAVRGFPHHAAYSASKWALRGLTQVAALEFAADRIRVNAVMPGPVATPMLSPEAVERLGQSAPLGRIGRPDDIAEVVAFLASPKAAYLTGADIVVDGGQSVQPPGAIPPVVPSNAMPR
jgi:NAD(P)-dependent dehydrogenase (short-subunit alcohol dehydrogenase family)